MVGGFCCNVFRPRARSLTRLRAGVGLSGFPPPSVFSWTLLIFQPVARCLCYWFAGGPPRMRNEPCWNCWRPLLASLLHGGARALPCDTQKCGRCAQTASFLLPPSLAGNPCPRGPGRAGPTPTLCGYFKGVIENPQRTCSWSELRARTLPASRWSTVANGLKWPSGARVCRGLPPTPISALW